MMNFNDMVACGEKYSTARNQMLIEQYKAFISYLNKIIKITFEDNKNSIISYLNEIENKELLLNWCVGGIHYIGFYIRVSESGSDIIVSALRAHDSYYDPVLDLTSDIKNDDLLQFLNKEYCYFIDKFKPDYQGNESGKFEFIDREYSLAYQISDELNDIIFKNFENNFKLFDINDIYAFHESKFSLIFTKKRRLELDSEIYKFYKSYEEQIANLMNKFNESVKDLK